MTKPKSSFIRAKYETLSNEKANSSCGTMQFQTGKTNYNFFGTVGMWYAPKEGNHYLEEAMGRLRHQTKRIIHKHFNDVIFTIINIDWLQMKQYETSPDGLSHFNLEWNVQLKEPIYLLGSLDIFKSINDEIINYLYSIEGCGFTHKGNRKPRKKTSEYLKDKLTTDITQ
jgi:hypothetical protein